MDDNGELDFSDHGMSSSSELARHFHSSAPSLDTFLDDLFRSTQACTHMHTCNPPGPDKTHTHTCYHTHTQLFASEEEEAAGAPTSAAATVPTPKKKRPLGNREAVRKYRERKKAHTVFLEDQVAKLKSLNQQLLKRLQGQAALESEGVRLRALLSQFRTCIDSELGPCASAAAAANPSQQILPGGFVLNSVNVPCVADVPCLHDQQPALDNSQQTSSERSWHAACHAVSEDCHGLDASGDLSSGSPPGSIMASHFPA